MGVRRWPPVEVVARHFQPREGGLFRMLYPLLHWDTRFPAGYTGETVDLLMMDAAARTLRGASEHPNRRHKVFEEELDDLRPRTWIAEKQRIDAVRNKRGVSVNMIGASRSDKDTQFVSPTASNVTSGTVMFGRSTSFLDRTRYLPATPKVRTEYPRFYTGFTHYPIFGRR